MDSLFKYLFILLFSFGCSSVLITGNVSELNGSPIRNVNVIISNSKLGSTTDDDGNFIIDLNRIEECELQVSHIGYEKYINRFDCNKNQHFLITLIKSSIDFSEIVVVATKSPKYLKDTPVLTHVISNNDIRESSSYNFSELLKEAMPNIQTIPSNHTGDRIKMQGLDNKYMLFLIDGDKISAEYAGNVDLSMININNIEKIEIIENSLSTLYGSNAIGGVVNIVSKKNKDQFWFNSVLSDDAIFGGNRSIALGNGFEKFSYNVNYSQQNFKGYDLTPTVINPFDFTLKGFDKKYYQHSFSYMPNPSFDLNLYYNKYHSFITDYDDAIDNTTNMQVQVYSDLLKKYEDNIYKIKINKLLSSESYIKFSMLYENYYKINFYPYYYNLNQSDLNINSEEFMAGELEHGNVYFQYNQTSNKHNIVIGLEKVFDYYYSYNIYDNDGILSSPSIFEGLNQSKKYSETSFFIHDQFLFSNDSEIYYGLRYTDAMNFSDKCILALSIINRHSSGYNVRFNISSGYRIPSLKELYYEYPAHFIPLYGNPDLKPTLSKNYSLSFEKRKMKNDFSVDFYIRNIENFISTEYVDASLIYRNYDYVIVNGMNMHYQRDINANNSLKFIYNYVDVESDSDEILELISNHSLYIKYKYLLSKNFSIMSNVRYAGEKFNFNQENDYVGLPSITILDPYWILDLMFLYNFSKNYDFKFGVKNLFDYKDSRTDLGDDLLNSYDPGRRLYFEIVMNYKKG